MKRHTLTVKEVATYLGAHEIVQVNDIVTFLNTERKMCEVKF